MWHKIHKIISLYKHKLYNSITIQGCVGYVETNWSTCHVVRKTKGWKWGLGIMFKFFHVILMSGGDLRTTDLKMKFQFLITAGRFLQGWAPIDLLFLITLRPSDCEHVLTKAHRSCFRLHLYIRTHGYIHVHFLEAPDLLPTSASYSCFKANLAPPLGYIAPSLFSYSAGLFTYLHILPQDYMYHHHHPLCPLETRT